MTISNTELRERLRKMEREIAVVDPRLVSEEVRILVAEALRLLDENEQVLERLRDDELLLAENRRLKAENARLLKEIEVLKSLLDKSYERVAELEVENAALRRENAALVKERDELRDKLEAAATGNYFERTDETARLLKRIEALRAGGSAAEIKLREWFANPFVEEVCDDIRKYLAADDAMTESKS